jgi:hypothetical protein
MVTPALWQVSEKEDTAAAWLLVVHDAYMAFWMALDWVAQMVLTSAGLGWVLHAVRSSSASLGLRDVLDGGQQARRGAGDDARGGNDDGAGDYRSGMHGDVDEGGAIGKGVGRRGRRRYRTELKREC